MTSHDLLNHAARVLMWSCLVGTLVTLAVYVLARVHCVPRRIATHGRFVFIKRDASVLNFFRRQHLMRTLFPGQSTIAAIQGLADDGTAVDTGPVNYVDPGVTGLMLTVDPDGLHATYTAAADLAPQDIPVVATFVNALGATITVNDTLSVLAQVAVATHGQFVFSVPAGAAKA